MLYYLQQTHLTVHAGVEPERRIVDRRKHEMVIARTINAFLERMLKRHAVQNVELQPVLGLDETLGPAPLDLVFNKKGRQLLARIDLNLCGKILVCDIWSCALHHASLYLTFDGVDKFRLDEPARIIMMYYY